MGKKVGTKAAAAKTDAASSKAGAAAGKNLVEACLSVVSHEECSVFTRDPALFF